jgi:hypothetical protein
VPAEPAVEPPAVAESRDAAEPAVQELRSGSGHLQSASVVAGVHVDAQDGEAGELADLMVDERTWQIHRVVVKRRDDGVLVLLPTDAVAGADWHERRAALALALDAVAAATRLE